MLPSGSPQSFFMFTSGSARSFPIWIFSESVQVLLKFSAGFFHCNTWEGGDTHKRVKDKESIKDRPATTLGRVDYLGKRLFKADREMARMLVMFQRNE